VKVDQSREDSDSGQRSGHGPGFRRGIEDLDFFHRCSEVKATDDPADDQDAAVGEFQRRVAGPRVVGRRCDRPGIVCWIENLATGERV